MNRRLAQGFSGDDASATRRPTRAVVALGANLGDREATLAAAVEDLRRMPLVDEVRVAPVMETIAVTPDGPDASRPGYLNSVAILTTRLAPRVLLDYLHAIERAHGRVRSERWGDRTLDLDLIAYGDLVWQDPALTLPHPRAAERDFVLSPWLALDPDAELPGSGRVDELLRRAADS